MLSEYENGETVTIYGALESTAEAESRKGGVYVVYTIIANGQTAKCYHWNTAKSSVSVKPKDVVEVVGTINVYNDARNIIVKSIKTVKEPSQEMLRDILPSLSEADNKFYVKMLKKARGAIQDEDYRTIVNAVLSKFGKQFVKAPAAKKNHDAFVGGLLKHTVNVCNICEAFVAVYQAAINADLLRTAAIVHDLGKIRTYEVGLAAIGVSVEGALLDHVFHSLSMLDEALVDKKVSPEKLLLIKHMIVSHHGQRDWGAVNEPSFPEAMLLHLADMADCHVTMMDEAIRDTEPGALTENKVWPYGRQLYRKVEDAGD